MRISDWSSDVCSSDLPIVIVTAYTDIQTIDLAKQIPPADRLFVLQKPFHTTEIQQLAIALTARWELEQAGTQEVSSVDLEALRRLEEMVRNLPGGVAVFDDKERLVRMHGALQRLFPDFRTNQGRVWKECVKPF